MKEHKAITPLKRVSLIFLTIAALSVSNSLLTSCSETAVAASDHSGIETRLTRIEAQLNDQGSTVTEMNTTVTTMANLTSSLSKDIGAMADRILEMADKIVETEVLIVEVITNQTAAATGTINTLTALKNDPSDPSEAPVKKFQSTDSTKPFYFNPNSGYALDRLLKGGAASSVALKTPEVLSVKANKPPSIAIFGNTPIKNYIIVASLDSTFVNPVQREINKAALANTPPPGNGPNPVNLGVAWKDIVGLNQLNIPLNNDTKVFVAIKSLDPTTGAVSGLSNSVAFTFN